jgi:hypothetical protein
MQIFTQEFKDALRSIFLNKNILKWSAIVVGVAVVVVLFFTLSPLEVNRDRDDESQEISAADTTIYEYGIPIAMYDVEEHKVEKGEFFSTILDKNGIPAKRVYDLTQKCKGVFDVRQIRVGHEYHTYFSKDSVPSLHYLVYERDAHSFVVFGLKDTLSVTIHEKEIETSLHYAEVTINSSLWVDLQKAGVSPLLALALSDIYAWSIDFFGLQKGDSFKALYEVMSYKGDVLDIGNVKYAEFVHSGKSYQADHYQLENQGNE